MNSHISELLTGLLARRRDCLARAITLIESSRADHQVQAQWLLQEIAANYTNNKEQLKYFDHKSTFRLGIAGPPGAGKSTFIEKMGLQLIQQSHRVAVIPVDPSSHISGGSILGDKTRMDFLGREENAYIRASPTRGVLGGVAEHTADVISLCEAAHFDTVIIESVGLGQSEVDIDRAVDMLVVILPPGGGDGLQASKKGIMEAADLVLVNKADGQLLESARHTKSDYSGAMQFIQPKYSFWRPKVMLVSAATGLNMTQVETEIRLFHKLMCENGAIQRKRASQREFWMWGALRRQLIARAEHDPRVRQRASEMVQALGQGRLVPGAAAARLLDEFIHSIKTPES